MAGQIALLNIRSVPGWLLTAPFVWFLAVGILITRLGLLARISFFLLVGFILYAPLTVDFARWYASYSAATLVLVLLFTLFAFKTALVGRKLFKTDLFEK